MTSSVRTPEEGQPTVGSKGGGGEAEADAVVAWAEAEAMLLEQEAMMVTTPTTRAEHAPSSRGLRAALAAALAPGRRRRAMAGCVERDTKERERRERDWRSPGPPFEERENES